ncbi:hypothetical protein JCM3770_005976 [Rhodotorula araucariae]
MPHTGAATPPLASPLLVGGHPGQGVPPPPSTANTPRAASTSPAGTPPLRAGQEQDPFLAQTAAIPLSERDRQEGYDVELLNARPRGRYSSDLAPGPDGDDDSLAREKYGAGLVSVHSHPALADAAPATALGPLGALGGAGLGPIGSAARPSSPGGGYGTGVGAGKEYGGDPAGGYSGARARPRRWYLRPLTLLILGLFIVAVALAVGLGVGLSERDSHSHAASDLPVNSTFRSRISSARSRTGTVSTGTVVPSSDTLYWSSLATATSRSSEAPSSTESDSVVAVTTTLPSVLTSIPSPMTATTLATSGNLPIPANSSTIINGITISALPPSADESLAPPTLTSRARMRRTMSFDG